jgi:nitroimidazol reductase NimA-like FMN-containing flavoprotein (pyridoxamine 5'-phosphate oxidase superfamily)
MARTMPRTKLDTRFSSDGASPTEWAEARGLVKDAEIFWVSTVRPDGRPHVTPLIAVWVDDALYFCTGATERKARNLAHNSHCILTTGCNAFAEGLDVVVEGDARHVTDDATLRRVADAYESKYGRDWRFTVRDGAFHHQGVHAGHVALVYELRPAKALGFRRGAEYSQTRWQF